MLAEKTGRVCRELERKKRRHRQQRERARGMIADGDEGQEAKKLELSEYICRVEFMRTSDPGHNKLLSAFDGRMLMRNIQHRVPKIKGRILFESLAGVSGRARSRFHTLDSMRSGKECCLNGIDQQVTEDQNRPDF